MIDKIKSISLVNQITTVIKNNFKFLIIIISFLLLIFIFFQYYLYQKNNKALELSILYDQAISSVNLNEFENRMNIIAKENGIYGILASLELIKKRLENKDYNYAYNEYLKLLKKK